MDLYTTYSEEEVLTASKKELQIVNDIDSNLREHLDNIKKRILLDDNTLLSMISAINAGFNIILYGPPGTAKSTVSVFLPAEIYGAKCNVHTADSEWNVRKVIGGINVKYTDTPDGPVEHIGPKDGYIVNDIMECYETRLETTECETVFTVIDEFNRTNMDECLGPMFTAMGSENKILKLDYNGGFNDDFLEVPIPKGYRIICNMNKYDRTFTNELSDALSRRFKWIYIGTPSQALQQEENDIVDGSVFGDVSDIAPAQPVNLQDISRCVKADFFENNVMNVILNIIDELRSDLEVGTSYKIDAVKLACYFMDLKLDLIDWDSFNLVDKTSVLDSNDVDTAALPITDITMQSQFKDILKQIITDSIDAALVMTIIPACEAIESQDAVDRNTRRFAAYERCTNELKRMKQSF